MIRIGSNICVENKQEFDEHWDAYNEKFDGYTILSNNFDKFPLFLLYDNTQKYYYYGTYEVVSADQWLFEANKILVEMEKSLNHVSEEFHKAKELKKRGDSNYAELVRGNH